MSEIKADIEAVTKGAADRGEDIAAMEPLQLSDGSYGLRRKSAWTSYRLSLAVFWKQFFIVVNFPAETFQAL